MARAGDARALFGRLYVETTAPFIRICLVCAVVDGVGKKSRKTTNQVAMRSLGKVTMFFVTVIQSERSVNK